MNNEQYIFVYGTLKSTESNNKILTFNGGEFQHPCTTVDEYFRGEGAWYPYLLEMDPIGFAANEVDYQEGELWTVPFKDMAALDRYEGYTEGLKDNLFYRKKIQVEIENLVVECWCYFLNPKELYN